MLKKIALNLALFCVTTVAHSHVLTTIKPLGFITNAITEGVTDTKVLLPISASPHDYSLKPSDISTLQSASLVIWIGEDMEGFLSKKLQALPTEKVLTLSHVEAINQFVEKEETDSHDHNHKEAHNHADHHHHHNEDWHIWLSPQMSEKIAEQIAERLSAQMPAQRGKIAENLQQFKQQLAEKNQQITQQLSPLKETGYYTFHDAYGYFEQTYGLNSLGSFTINPAIAPGAKTLNAIKRNIEKHHAKCLFTEPQFTPKVVESLTQNTNVKIGRLDPLGSEIPLSQTAYLTFLQQLADQFSYCLDSTKQ